MKGKLVEQFVELAVKVLKVFFAPGERFRALKSETQTADLVFRQARINECDKQT